MSAIFRRPVRRSQARGSARARPSVEPLEARDCPAAPAITLEVTVLGCHLVRLSGTVTDENPQTAVVTFTGAVEASTSPDAAGNYSLEVEAPNLDEVLATALDEEQLTSNTAQGYVSSDNPEIADFEALEGPGGVWTFRGWVIDESPAGMSVRLGGLPSLAGVTTTADADGWFSVQVQLGQGEQGTATAQTTDCWGLESDVAEALVRPT